MDNTKKHESLKRKTIEDLSKQYDFIKEPIIKILNKQDYTFNSYLPWLWGITIISMGLAIMFWIYFMGMRDARSERCKTVPLHIRKDGGICGPNYDIDPAEGKRYGGMMAGMMIFTALSLIFIPITISYTIPWLSYKFIENKVEYIAEVRVKSKNYIMEQESFYYDGEIYYGPNGEVVRDTIPARHWQDK